LSELESAASLLRVALGRAEPTTLRSADWDAWVWLARRERVVPLLYHLVDTVPTDLTDDQREEITQLQGATLSRCVQLEHHMVAVSRLFAHHGIRSAVLKGGATAHLDYPDSSWREVSDIDVLVEPRELGAATALLAPERWVQGYALPSGHAQFTHAVTFVRDQMELDLHQRIARRALGLRVPSAELLDAAISFEVAGFELRALNDLDRIVHAALHMVAARGLDRALSSVADVLVMADRRPYLAVEALARAERWRVRPLLERGVREAYARAHLDVHTSWAEAMRLPIRHRDRLVERAYLSARRSPLVRELAYARLLKGWRNRWRYLVGYFKTDPDYARQHRRSGVRAQSKYVLSKLRGRS